jgi:GNAT superfamily N-acetyltransferase
MEPTIRKAEPGDVRPIAKVHVESWLAAYSTILGPEKMSQLSVDEREHAWAERLNVDSADPLRAFVIELEGTVVGFSLTLPGRDDDLDPTTTAELVGLYFVRSAWRQGLGTKLQARALDELRVQGFQHAVLWVLEDNDRARRFYEASGWHMDKRDPSYRDFNAACLRYRLAL